MAWTYMIEHQHGKFALFVGHVDPQPDGMDAQFAQLGNGTLGGAVVEVADRDPCSALAKGDGDGIPDPAGRPGDQCVTALQRKADRRKIGGSIHYYYPLVWAHVGLPP